MVAWRPLALADPTRRRIVELLRDGEMAAGDLSDEFSISRPAASRHLRVLRGPPWRLSAALRVQNTVTRLAFTQRLADPTTRPASAPGLVTAAPAAFPPRRRDRRTCTSRPAARQRARREASAGPAVVGPFRQALRWAPARATSAPVNRSSAHLAPEDQRYGGSRGASPSGSRPILGKLPGGRSTTMGMGGHLTCCATNPWATWAGWSPH